MKRNHGHQSLSRPKPLSSGKKRPSFRAMADVLSKCAALVVFLAALLSCSRSSRAAALLRSAWPELSDLELCARFDLPLEVGSEASGVTYVPASGDSSGSWWVVAGKNRGMPWPALFELSLSHQATNGSISATLLRTVWLTTLKDPEGVAWLPTGRDNHTVLLVADEDSGTLAEIHVPPCCKVHSPSSTSTIANVVQVHPVRHLDNQRNKGLEGIAAALPRAIGQASNCNDTSDCAYAGCHLLLVQESSPRRVLCMDSPGGNWQVWGV
jgi:hypothetical protein